MPRGSELTTPCSFWGRWDSGAEGQHAGVGGCEDLGMGETNSSAPRSVRQAPTPPPPPPAQAAMGRESVGGPCCLCLAFCSINRKLRMSGLGVGRAHEQWQEALWSSRALELCFLPWSMCGNHWGAPEEGHSLPQAN